MRNLLIAIALLTASVQVYAQNNNVVSANRHLSDFTQGHDTNDLKDAKTAIDLAAVNEKTKDEPKMYLYRGQVYETIYETTLSNNSKKALMAAGKMDQAGVQKAQAVAYEQTDTSALGIAAYSYLKVIELEPKGGYADEAKQYIVQCIGHMENKAVCDYNAQNFASSFIFFERVLMGEKSQGVADTSSHYRHLLQNTASTAEKAKNTPKAIQYYNEMISIKAGKDLPYSALNRIYMAQGDTNKALDIIAQGRAAYPDDLNLLNAQTNGYLWRGQNDKAEDNLQLAIDKMTKEPKLEADQKELLSRLYAILGGIYDRVANPRDEKGQTKPMPGNYNDMFQKADTNYKMALGIAPDDFDYNFALGALYNNRAKYIYDQLRAMSDKEQAAKSKTMEADAKTWLVKAQPFLEKAFKMKPDDHQLRMVLIGLYASTGQDDKAKALTDQK
ncbi:MAG: tetratricopeptide repeat protein [Bacteroidia bacterium]